MYSAGDNIGAVVGDIGSVCSKIGFAGEDFPRCVSCSSFADGMVYQYHVDAQWERTDMELRSAVGKAGAVQDWDMVEKIWEHAAVNKSPAAPAIITAVLCTHPCPNLVVQELMFEKFDVPALFMGRDAVLSCFSLGKTTGTAVDVGGHTTVTPVTDGWVDHRAIVTASLGATALHRYCTLLMEATGTTLKPTQAFRTGCKPRHFTPEHTWHPSYREFVQLEVARDIIETSGRVSETAVDDQAPQFTSVPGVPYRLPDGSEVTVGVERFKVPELLFNTDPFTTAAAGTPLAAFAESLTETDTRLVPLQNLVLECIQRCDGDAQQSLASTIVVSGGGSGFDGMPERLRSEVDLLIAAGAPMWRPKVLAAGANERRISAWLGGSILGSLGSFHEMWMSKSEYEEHGARLINKKCP
ncbi:actin family [Tribonema minus]|uniref:Actin family n=1 Tax=Tribonema minus TaxID=303371 RepID=A0A835Z589_9STRA|nr:actin family [Tribonema minus]